MSGIMVSEFNTATNASPVLLPNWERKWVQKMVQRDHCLRQCRCRWGRKSRPKDTGKRVKQNYRTVFNLFCHLVGVELMAPTSTSPTPSTRKDGKVHTIFVVCINSSQILQFLFCEKITSLLIFGTVAQAKWYIHPKIAQSLTPHTHAKW